MNKSPQVSVCVTTYNYGRFLPDCIESVQQQTMTDWELVICDDQSSDGTEAIVARYAARDPRIRYIRHPKRLGMNPNLKFASEQGRGKYLKILCADDWIAPQCLEVMVSLMEQHHDVVLGTSAEVFTNEIGEALFVQFLFGKPVSVVSGERMLDRMAAGHGFGGNSSFIIRRSAYHQVGGFDRSVVYAGDYELAARLCRAGDYLHTDEPLFYGRHHDASSTSLDPKLALNVQDYLVIPGRIFRDRKFPNHEWRRYQRLMAHFTALFLTYVLSETIRGRHDYVRRLWPVLRRGGNFPAGLTYLPFHLVKRAWAWSSGQNFPRRKPPEPGMGSPSLIRGDSVIASSL